MAVPTDERRQKLQALLALMGWRKSSQTSRWVKFYPPPHDLPTPMGHSRVIAVQGSVDWLRDLQRAKTALEHPDPFVPMPLADYTWNPPD